MATTRMLVFPQEHNGYASQLAHRHILVKWREMLGEFRRKHTLTASEQELIKGLKSDSRPASFEQWMRGFSLVAKYATPQKMRRYFNDALSPLLDLCAGKSAPISLGAAARDEFLTGITAERAQFAIIEHYATCSDAELMATLKATEDHIASAEVYADTVRTELARRDALVAA